MFPLMRDGVAKLKRGSRYLRKALRKLRKKKHPSFKLWLEPLEDRTLMAVSITGAVFQDVLLVNGNPDAGEGVPGIVAYLDTQTVTSNGTTTPALTPPPGTPAVFGGATRLHALQASGIDAPMTDVNLRLDVSKVGAGTAAFILLSPAGVVYGANPPNNAPANNAGARLFVLSGTSGFNGTLDDQAASTTLVTTPTITSTTLGTGAGSLFKPNQPFSQLDRLIYQGNPNGTWYLVVENTAGVTINSWSLTFTEPAQLTTTDANGNYSFSGLQDNVAHTVSIAVPNAPAPQIIAAGGNPGAVANFAVAQPPAHDNQALTSNPSAQQQPSIAVNPTNPNHIVVAYMDYNRTTYNGFARIAVQTTTNGGATWTQSFVPLPVFAGDPAQAAGYAKAAFDMLGNVYVSFMAATFHGPQPPLIFPDGTRDQNNVLFRAYGLESTNGIFVAKSSVGGQNPAGVDWGTPSAVTLNVHTPGGPKVAFFDVLPDMAVDTTAQSATVNNVYVTWTRIYRSGAMTGDTAQTVAIRNAATGAGSTFMLTFDGQTTAPLAWNASAATVQTELRALTSINNAPVTVTRTGTDGNQIYTVVFPGNIGRAIVPQITSNVSALTVGTANLITGASNPGTIVITSNAHGLVTGATVKIDGVLGNTAANGLWTITVLSANTFSLNNSQGNGNFTSGGRWTTITGTTVAGAFIGGNGGTDVMVARFRAGQDPGLTFTTLLTTATATAPTPISIINVNRTGASDEGGGFNNFSKITILYNLAFTGGLRVAFNSGGRFFIATINTPEGTLTTGNAEAFFNVPQGSTGQVNSIFPDLELYPGAPLHNFPVRNIVADPVRTANLYVIEAVKQNSGLNTTTGQFDRGDIQFGWSQSNGGNIANFRRTFTVGNNTGNEEEVNDTAFNNLRDFFTPLNDDNNNRYLRFDQTLQDEVITTQAQPMLAVDRATGNLVAIWLDNRRDPTGRKFDIWGSVSTDGGVTWSANFRITDVGFDPSTGKFVDPRGNQNAFIGDSLGLAVAGGFVYTAWTDTRDGNQNIYFSKFAINPGVSTPGDRFEDNDSAATATPMGDIGAEQFFPKLTLTAGDEDWFLVSPQGGKLFASIQGSAAVQGLQLQLFNGAQLLAGGGDVIQNNQFIRKEISQALAAGSYLLKVSGATATTEYSLRLNSLTADLGTTVYASSATNSALAGTIGEAGAKKLYAVTSAVAGSIEIDLQGNLALIPRVNGEGVAIETATPVNIIMEILSADGTTVLDSFSVPSGTTVVRRRVAVDAGQGLLISLKADDSAVPLGRELSGGYNLVVTNLDQYQTSLRSSLFFATGATPTDLAVGDLNNDGKLDLIAATTDPTSAVNVLRGTGLGVFWAAQGYKAGAQGASREVIVDKFNGADDAFDDVVVSNFNSADISLLTGLGDTTLAPERRSDATARALALAAGDFNGDGFKDLVVLERTPAAGMTSNFAVILGRGDGTFGPPTKTATTLRAGANVVLVGDVNGDGRADIIVLGGNEAVIEVHLGNGNGTFQPAVVNVGPEAAAAAVVKDLNGDGRADIIVGGQNNGRVYVLTSLTDGTFGAPLSLFANTNANAAAASIASIVVVDAGRNVANGFLAAKDGIDDIIVVTVPRVGNEGPHINFLAGLGAGTYGAAQRVRSGAFTGPLAAGDFDNDGEIDLAAAEPGGIRAIYSRDITFPANTTMGAARNLGDLKHVVTPPQAISPLVTESWFKLTVPTDTAGTGDQVLDFSALLQNLGGGGIGVEVWKKVNGVDTRIASGTRFRLSAAQGETLFVRVFSQGGTGFGIYTLSIDVLPQIASVQALTILPSVLGQPSGPVSSLLLTIQGDRLDRATAENAANYRVVWFGLDGIADTADDQVIPLSEQPGAVIYNQGANTGISSGRTLLGSTRQTITLNFDDPLPAGSYRIEIVGIQTDDFNSAEDSQLVAAPGINGHSLVTLSGGVITEGAAVTVAGLVKPAGSAFNYDQIGGGTAFLTQLHDDLGALLDSLLAQLGDDPEITVALTDLIQSRIEAITSLDPQLTFAILWFDPVSISLEDPQGARTTYNLQTNTLVSSTARTYIEVGGNVQVIVMAGVSGSFQLNVSDVQNTARGGGVLASGGKIETVALTDAMRSGTLSFEVNVPPPPPAVPAVPPSSGGAVDVSASAIIDSSVATLTTILVGLGNVSGPDLGGVDSEELSLIAALRLFVTTVITQWPAYATEVAASTSNFTQLMTALDTVADSAGAITEAAWTNIEQTLPGAREFGDLVEELANAIGRTGAEVGQTVVNAVRSRLNGAAPPVAAPGAPKEEGLQGDETEEQSAAAFEEADLPVVPLHETDNAFLVASLFAAGAINQAYRPREVSKDNERKNRKTLVPQS